MIAGLCYLVDRLARRVRAGIRKAKIASAEREVNRTIARILGERAEDNPNLRARGLVFDARVRTRIPKVRA